MFHNKLKCFYLIVLLMVSVKRKLVKVCSNEVRNLDNQEVKAKKMGINSVINSYVQVALKTVDCAVVRMIRRAS